MDKILPKGELQRLLIQKKKLTAADTFRVAEHYYACSDYDSAFQWYLAASKKPSTPPNAYFNLGYACQHGEGTKADMAEALRWYQKAADAQVPQAYYNLAYFYQNGIIVQQDEQKANDCVRQAAALLDRLTDAHFQLTEQRRTLEGRVSSLEVLLAECTERRDALEQQDAKLQVQLQGEQEKNTNLAAELQSERKLRQSLEERSQKAARELSSAQEQCRLLESRCADLKNARTTLQELHKNLQFSYSSLSQDSKKVADLQQSLQEELSRLNGQLERNESKLSKAGEDAAACRRELAEANKNLMDTKLANKDLSSTNDQLKQRRPFMKKRTVLIGLNIFACVCTWGAMLTHYFLILRDYPVSTLLFAAGFLLSMIFGIVFAVKNKTAGYCVANLAGTAVLAVFVLHSLRFFSPGSYGANTMLTVCSPPLLLFVTAGILAFKKEEL